MNVTDLDFDRGGSMWFVTGGRKTRSSLYRVRYTGAATGADQPSTPQVLARAEFSARSRDRRRILERFHAHSDPAALDVIWPSLADSDPWIRGAARVALEWQPVDQWRAAERIAAMESAAWGRSEKLVWLRVHQLVDSSGDTVTTGRIIRDDFRESQLILAPQADAPLQWATIPKAEIESWQESPVSPMPAGLLDTLTPREVEDLLAFLLADGEAE